MGAIFFILDSVLQVGGRVRSGHENLFIFNNLEFPWECSFLGVPLNVSLDSSGFEYLRAASAKHTRRRRQYRSRWFESRAVKKKAYEEYEMVIIYLTQVFNPLL